MMASFHICGTVSFLKLSYISRRRHFLAAGPSISFAWACRPCQLQCSHSSFISSTVRADFPRRVVVMLLGFFASFFMFCGTCMSLIFAYCLMKRLVVFLPVSSSPLCRLVTGLLLLFSSSMALVNPPEHNPFLIHILLLCFLSQHRRLGQMPFYLFL